MMRDLACSLCCGPISRRNRSGICTECQARRYFTFIGRRHAHRQRGLDSGTWPANEDLDELIERMGA